MKLPSLDQLVQTTTDTIRRFPLVIVAALCLACVGWMGIDDLDWIRPGHFFASALGLSLFLAVYLFAERKNSSSLRWILLTTAFALVVVYGFLSVNAGKQDVIEAYRFGLFILVAHLLVAISPFIRAGSLDAFWEFNKTLFLRFLLALLFSGVLFGGISVAFLAIDHLLLSGEVIEPEAYGKLFLIVGTLFNTIFFLAGVPKDFKSLEEKRPYPKGLQVLAQNLLLPLVVLYLGILYVYAVSVVVKWEWPQGWIGWLVMCFSVLGILALLLLYPVQEDREKGWIRRFSRWFYIALLPLVVFLFTAIFRRISEYGITENRYFVVLLACWLSGISLYFLLSKKKNIKVIPASLSVVVLLSSVGPWSAFSISIGSQTARFQELVIEHDVLVDGVIDPEKAAMLENDEKEDLSSILEFLSERKRLEAVAEMIPGGVSKSDDDWDVVERTGLRYGYAADFANARLGQIRFDLQGITTHPTKSRLVDVHGFDFSYSQNHFYNPGPSGAGRSAQDSGGNGSNKELVQVDSFEYKAREYRLMYESDRSQLWLLSEGDTLRFDLLPILLHELPNTDGYTPATIIVQDRTLEAESSTMRGRLVLERASGFYNLDANHTVDYKTLWLDSFGYKLLVRNKAEN